MLQKIDKEESLLKEMAKMKPHYAGHVMKEGPALNKPKNIPEGLKEAKVPCSTLMAEELKGKYYPNLRQMGRKLH